ncbi:Uncharacterised protein [Mycobacteroides abscessus subsp. abscessus]|nr:Uncharacterised protein [Mycobacteroides abscessus subsp. abscessus]
MASMPSPPKRSINSWRRTYQSVWDEHALNYRAHDAWFRVFAFAVARAGANGHAPCPQGEIAKVLGRPRNEGMWIPASPSGVSQAISLAKEKGLLHNTSHARCLVLPSHAWAGGLGSAVRQCPVHG